MALTTCPECNHEISHLAHTCPSCGHPLITSPEAVPTAGSPTATNGSQLKVLAYLTIAAGMLIALGSLLPWRTVSAPLVGTVNANGTEGDGILTLILGVLIAASGIVRAMYGRSMLSSIAGVVFTVFAAFVTYTAFKSAVEAIELVQSDLARASIGIGLWVVLVGVVCGFVGTFGSLTKRTE